MAKTDDLFKHRKSLDEICEVPEKIISVYSLEKHVWADSNSIEARKAREPELKTVEEFQLDPVRPFLTDILRNMAAPYKREKKENPVGQGYWIQAEFGSGKSHLLCLLSSLALGSADTWEIVKTKEQKGGRGKRESLYQFWEEGLQSKSSNRGIFVFVKTLVGAGGGVIGFSDKGQKLSEYILDAAKEQLRIETGKNLSLYPAELLADRFLREDLNRYKTELKKFLKDPDYFEEDEFEDADDFINVIKQNKSPEYKRSCGNKLWRFYDEYLKVQPHIEAETEEILKNMVEVILSEGYSGVLLVLDEISLFMKNRDEDQRIDDEQTLVVLSNRLAKIHNLPLWTVCAAQQAIESKLGIKNIIADDRLKLFLLLEKDKDYYDIVLARVREIKNPGAISNYYIHYKKGFTWPDSIGEPEFTHFFPFHKPAIEVLRSLTYELTTTRSAIHFMHQTLKHQIKNKGSELIRLWELFDETVRYEEDPSGIYAGLVAIKTKKEHDYNIYEVCKRQIESLTKGILKVHRNRAIKILQTFFLYHIAKTRQQGITPEEIANSILIEKDIDANPEENIQHYETIAENLKKELRQIVQTFDEDHKARYRFDPVVTGIDPRQEFQKARDDAEADENMRHEAWAHLLGLKEWPVHTRQITFDLTYGVRSIFRNIAPFKAPWEDITSKHNIHTIDIIWKGRSISGIVDMRDLLQTVLDNKVLPAIESEQTDFDFAVFISTRPLQEVHINKILSFRKDPRVIIWSPAELTKEEQDRLLEFAAYRKLVSSWQGKETEDAVSVINWVFETLKTELGKIAKIVESSYARGRMDAINNSNMDFLVAGELNSILSSVVDRVLSSTYYSSLIKFDSQFIFRKEEAVKVINGIVRTGSIPKGAKPNQNISAAQNFGTALKLFKKSSDRELDVSENEFVQDLWKFIDEKLSDTNPIMKVETLYKNFMGIGGPKNYGLTRRMVQIYLLCLVQKGKIKITPGAKSGLNLSVLDYSNISDVDFSTKILDSLIEVQKMLKPEGWEALVPYIEVILEEKIPPTYDDSEISRFRKKIKDNFAKECNEAGGLINRASRLFGILSFPNPYKTEVEQIGKLFSTPVDSGNDIDTLLYAFKEIFGYKACETGFSEQAEIDDLANRLKNYRDIQKFVSYDIKLKAIHAYCNHKLPHLPELKDVICLQGKLTEKLSSLKNYIDSEIKLKTELTGNLPPGPGEKETLGVLIRDYNTFYIAMHDKVTECSDRACSKIEELLGSNDFKALMELEKISALHPAISDKLARQLKEFINSIFTCSSSIHSIAEQLNNEPFDKCGLTFQSAEEHMNKIEDIEKKALKLFDEDLNRKMEVFTNSSVRKNLEQGKSDPVIKGLLECQHIADIRLYLVKSVIHDPSIVQTINRYLKRIIVRQVKISDFKPSSGTIEKEQIPSMVREFQKYLEQELKSIESDENTLPMLQLE